MSLPETQEEQVTQTQKWRVEEILLRRLPPGDTAEITTIERHVVDGIVTERQRRKLVDSEKFDQLWSATAKKTFKSWVVDTIIPNAEEV